MPSPTAHRPRRPRWLNVEPLEDRTCPTITISGPTTLHAGDRVQIEATTMKENRRLQVLPIAEAGGVFFIASIWELSASLRALVIRWSK